MQCTPTVTVYHKTLPSDFGRMISDGNQLNSGPRHGRHRAWIDCWDLLQQPPHHHHHRHDIFFNCRKVHWKWCFQESIDLLESDCSPLSVIPLTSLAAVCKREVICCAKTEKVDLSFTGFCCLSAEQYQHTQSPPPWMLADIIHNCKRLLSEHICVCLLFKPYFQRPRHLKAWTL